MTEPQPQVLLREYLDARFLDLREHLDTRFKDHEAQDVLRAEQYDRALEIARDSMNQRLEIMNALRTQILSERGSFATRDQVEALKEWVDQATGRSQAATGRAQAWTMASLIVSTLAAVASVTILVLRATAGGG